MRWTHRTHSRAMEGNLLDLEWIVGSCSVALPSPMIRLSSTSCNSSARVQFCRYFISYCRYMSSVPFDHSYILVQSLPFDGNSSNYITHKALGQIVGVAA